jgi:hypothetical protein
MANKAYRSIATGNWSNSTGTVWAVYSGTWNGTSFNAGSWGTAAANDYPTTDDFVWLQSTFIVTYDATAITANNSATFKQVSARTDASGSLVAQPSTGGSNLSSGYIQFTSTTSTTFNATLYAPYAQSGTGMFYLNNSNLTISFTGTQLQATTGSFIYGLTTATGINLTYNGDLIAGTSGTSGQAIFLGCSNSTINITGKLTSTSSSCLDVSSRSGITINVTGDVYGSDNSSTVYGISCVNTSGTNTVTVSGSCYSGTLSSAINLVSTTTNNVTITGANRIIRNYGATGSNYVTAILAFIITIPSSATVKYKTSDAGNKDYTTAGATTFTVQDVWNYLTSNATTAGSLGKLIVDNLNAKVGDVKTSTDRIPTNPASVQSTGDQIATIN